MQQPGSPLKFVLGSLLRMLSWADEIGYFSRESADIKKNES